MAPEKHQIGNPFVELRSVDSTNNYAMRQVHAGVAQHGFTVFAHEQTAGKGQRARQWLAQRDKNIMMSVVIAPGTVGLTRPAFVFSMAMAVAVHGLLKKLVEGDVKIKWPNDLFIGDRKAGGILIENILGSVWKAAVVGVGLNINQTDFGALENKAVSLKQLTGKDYDTITLAKELCYQIHRVLKKLETEPEHIVKLYHQHLYKRGEQVTLKKGTRIFEAQVHGVNAAGQLITHHATEEVFNVGEVEWVAPLGPSPILPGGKGSGATDQ